jgi:hypothetical protein
MMSPQRGVSIFKREVLIAETSLKTSLYDEQHVPFDFISASELNSRLGKGQRQRQRQILRLRRRMTTKKQRQRQTQQQQQQQQQQLQQQRRAAATAIGTATVCCRGRLV